MKFLFISNTPTGSVRVVVGAASVEQADAAVRKLYPNAVFMGIVARE